MRKLLLKICYDGTDFCGWQFQPNGYSVQSCVGDALFDLLGERVNLTGCSRTDSGVHANEFFCHFETTNDKISAESFSPALNVRLPDSVAAVDCFQVSDGFHARYDAIEKQYIYRIYCSRTKNPFIDKYALRIFSPVNVDAVNRFCAQLVGTHDFAAFSNTGRQYTSTVRTVNECFLKKTDDEYVFTVSGDGFLYNMVRIMVGTALCVSDGKISPDAIPAILKSGDRSALGPTAPAKGLFLNKVVYKDGSF